MTTNKDFSKLKTAVMSLGDVTLITRFHRNVETLKEMGLGVRCFSINPRGLDNIKRYEGVIIDGFTRRFRGRLFAPLRQFEITLRFFMAVLCYRPDVLYAHNLPALLVAWLVRLSSGKWKAVIIYDAMELESKRVSNIKSFIPFLPRDFQRIQMERFLVKRADLVTSADFARSREMSEILKRDDILTCRNVPMLKDIPRGRLFHENLALDDDAFIFLYQGAMIKGRGLEQGIRSLKSLPEKIVFVIVGMGTTAYLDVLRQLAESEGVSERLFLLPPVPSEQLLKWTASADVVHSLIENVCLSYYLAAPNKFYEAAMAGVPVIASRFPEMESVLERYPYGVLVNPEVVDEISKALLLLYEDPAARSRYRKIGLEASRSELNWEQESEKLKQRIAEATARLF